MSEARVVREFLTGNGYWRIASKLIIGLLFERKVELRGFVGADDYFSQAGHS